MFFFDPLYLIIAMPALLLALYAQAKVKSAYAKYLRVPNMRNISGEETARHLLAAERTELRKRGRHSGRVD